jgi:hypothetical protein
MTLPGFTAELVDYRSPHTYRSAFARDALRLGLMPAAYEDQDFCSGRELDANYAHPDDCGRYISCDLSGRAQEMPCAAGLHFMSDDTRWGHCDYPHIAKCDPNAY